MNFHQTLENIAIESFLKEGGMKEKFLKRESIDTISPEERAQILAYMKEENDKVRAKHNIEIAAENEVKKGEFKAMIENNRTVLLATLKKEVTLTKTLINKLLVWNPSRYGHRKSDVVNEILNTPKSTYSGVMMYASGTYTEKTGAYASGYSLYVDYEISVMAKVKIAGDAHDFEPSKITEKDILEIYKFKKQ